jgi:16S rRNA (cytidine1402-2'-O)-methyltransferase
LPGKLLVIATPIGNLSDMSDRLKDSLRNCDLILAEDTRVSIKLLNHLGIKKRMVSCHNFNERTKLKDISKASELNQTVALLSDAGTPLVSDPGFQIVREAIACKMEVIPIPGPSAFLVALVGSGLPCERFCFEGFLPEKQGAVRAHLAKLDSEERTMVFYISPHKIDKTLALMEAIWHDRLGCVARELTKLHEEFLRGTIAELRKILSDKQILGECVLVVEGRRPQENSDVESDEKRN